ncbi:MAG: glycosyltransferase [Chthoniobacter sp.]|uniref:glycosyltransferase family 4 protein n=1 Tax=Chthoniobacter sp. TaxID=2510640 RepID=UPI0032AB4876
MSRPKILISVIACDPYGGSEALHGWLVCRSLATIGDLWLLVSAEYQATVEKGRDQGMVPDSMHFVFVGEAKGYHDNRMLARVQSWARYISFNRAILRIAREWHEREHFDLAHHVTYSTWRVGSPLWRLGIPFIYGPISGTEVFPLRKFAHILSSSAKAFEMARILGGLYSRATPEVRSSLRQAFHIFAAHREAVPHLAALRGTTDGISVLSYYTFTLETIAALARPAGAVRPAAEPLKILAGGNLEGRKGVALALEGLAIAKKAGARFVYRVTGCGPELEHLQRLAERLGIADEVRLGQGFTREDYTRELQDTDLYLLPSLREGGGLTMMEAMLAGCVPIVAETGGPGTAVADGCGVRVPIESPQQMAREIAAAVLHFDQHRDLLAPTGSAAARHIAQHYSHERFIAAMRDVYAAALGSECQ